MDFCSHAQSILKTRNVSCRSVGRIGYVYVSQSNLQIMISSFVFNGNSRHEHDFISRQLEFVK
jgi:hypothetical protein